MWNWWRCRLDPALLKACSPSRFSWVELVSDFFHKSQVWGASTSQGTRRYIRAIWNNLHMNCEFHLGLVRCLAQGNKVERERRNNQICEVFLLWMNTRAAPNEHRAHQGITVVVVTRNAPIKPFEPIHHNMRGSSCCQLNNLIGLGLSSSSSLRFDDVNNFILNPPPFTTS